MAARGRVQGDRLCTWGRCDLQLPLEEVAVRNGGRRCGCAFEQHEEEEEAERELLREHRAVAEHRAEGRREYAPRCEAYEECAAQAAQRCPDVRIVEEQRAHRPREAGQGEPLPASAQNEQRRRSQSPNGAR